VVSRSRSLLASPSSQDLREARPHFSAAQLSADPVVQWPRAYVGPLALTFVALRSIGGGRPTLEEGNLWVRATKHAIVKRKKGDDRAATTFMSVGDRPDAAGVGNGSDPVG
jgi:hypothetical protein